MWLLFRFLEPRKNALKYANLFAKPEGGGQGWIRTSVRLRGQIYSLLPLTTRPPVQMPSERVC